MNRHLTKREYQKILEEENRYCINIANELVKKFPDTKVKFENHQMSNTFFFELISNSNIKFNEEFMEWECDTIMQLIEDFPDKNSCFLYLDDLVKIEKVDYEVEGETYI